MRGFYIGYIQLISLTSIFVGLSISHCDISPFSSVRFNADDDIIVAFDNERSSWHKLLSVNSIGIDSIVNFSKEHYGKANCDYEFPCFKYHIIENISKVFKQFQGYPLGDKVELELLDGGQNGFDTKSTKEKFDINSRYFVDNIRASKLALQNSSIFSGLRYLC